MSLHIGLIGSFVMSIGLAAQPQWTRPPLHDNRFGHVSAFDTARGRLVVFGGSTYVGAVAETWEWDGANWTRLHPAQSPPGGTGHAMTYDALRQRSLLFASGGTWEWDGSAWLQRTPTRAPSPRDGHCLTWDDLRQRALLFGGSDATGLRDDTWEWDGTNWTAIQSNNRPPRRTRAAMTFVAHRGRILLTGGMCPSFGPCAHNDAWEWDGTDWTPLGAMGGFGRWDHRLAYDPLRQRVLMFGGSDEPAHYFGDTWEWDGTNWLQFTPTVNAQARAAYALEYDPRSQSVTLTGGVGWMNDVYGDVWRWSATANAWLIVSRGQPTWREMPAMTNVASSGRTVMFGGFYNGVETWEWDGSRWTYHDLSGPPPRTPPANQGACLTSDGARAWLATGSTATELWSWDGSNWSRTPTAVVPPGGEAHALTFDAARAELVLLTAATTIRASETYTSNRSDWRRRQSAVEPPPRQWHAMAYDAVRERVVLFGGMGMSASGPLSDTWEWDGQSWRQLFPAHVPSPRSRHRLIYDQARRRVVMLGWGSRPDLEVWEWDGADWQERVVPGGPPYPARLGAAYDNARSEVVVFAGVPDQTWRLAPTTLARYTTIGAGCAGTRGIPTLSSRGGQRPWLGDTFSVEIGNLPSSPLVVLLVGASRQQWGAISLPTPLASLGMLGCTLHVSGEVTIPFTNVSGQVSWSVVIPAEPALAGAQFYNQAWVADPLANPGNAIMSAAAEAMMALR